MDKFIKRLQTRASRKGITVSKSQVREVYTEVVAVPESPTDEEMSAIILHLEQQYQAPSFTLAISQEAKPLVKEESPVMPQAQPTVQPTNSTLATSTHSSISQAPSANLSLTQEQIQQAVEQQFGKESVETKTAILNYVAKDTFSTAQELQHALAKLRQTKLDILMKLISDHNSQASLDEEVLKNALLAATANRQRETEDFFGSFENQLSEMRTAFGV